MVKLRNDKNKSLSHTMSQEKMYEKKGFTICLFILNKRAHTHTPNSFANCVLI